MKWLRRAVVLVTTVAAPVLRADVIIRYTHDFKTSSPQVSGAMPSALMPQFTVIKVKGKKAYSDVGVFESVLDAGTGQITLMDAARKRFAKAAFQDYLNQIEPVVPSKDALPEDAQKALAAMKSSVAFKKTGRTDVIQGVQAQETEVTFTVDMAMPEGIPQNGPLIKMVMQLWTAQPEEALRHPALRELNEFRAYSSYFANPMDALPKILANMPGSSQDLISGLQKLSEDGALMLRFHMSAFMPMVAQMAQQGHPVPGLDANGPLMEMTTEIAEISTAAIEDSVFEIPAGFTAAPIGEVMKSLVTAARPGVAATPK